MKYPEFRFECCEFQRIGQAIGDSLISRLKLSIYALTVREWHVHCVIGATEHPIGSVVKCLKDSVRWELRPGQPIWTDGFDKRYCFDDESVRRRVRYVEQHNLEVGVPAHLWSFIVKPDSPVGQRRVAGVFRIGLRCIHRG